MTNEERNIAIADMRRMKAEYMNGREMDKIAERKCKSFDIAIKALEQQPNRDKNPCETCGYVEGSPFCLEYCPYDAERMKEQEPTVQYKQAESEKYQKAFDDGYANGYAQAKFDYEQQPCERFEWGIDGNVYKITKAKDGKEICQQVCNDAISREAAIKTVHKMRVVCDTEDIDDYYELLVESFKQLPPVTPKQKYGKWIDYSDEGFVECPFCGHATNCEDNINELHYCFHCGAKMQESEDKK